jgi:hypothetical protein
VRAQAAAVRRWEQARGGVPAAKAGREGGGGGGGARGRAWARRRRTWILFRVRGLSMGLTSAQTALNTMGALMMQMRPSISG